MKKNQFNYHKHWIIVVTKYYKVNLFGVCLVVGLGC